MSKEQQISQQQQDYDAAFDTSEAPGYKIKALGILVMIGGIVWSVISYLGGNGSLLPLPPCTAILGAVLCGVGEINELRYTIQQNQLRNEYFAKYGFEETKSEE